MNQLSNMECKTTTSKWVKSRILLGVYCITIVAITLSAAPAAERDRPNMVVFLTDDLGQLDSEPYGAKDIRTPHLRELAANGLTFTHAFVASPSCAPSRAALLTGLMPARNGAEANHSHKHDHIVSLTENLKSLGYEIAAFGKVAHGRGKGPGQHGFDVIQHKHDIDSVRTFLTSRDQSKPLCLFVGTHEPHVAWPSIDGYSPDQVILPPTFVDTPETREYRARYYTDVTEADSQLGGIRSLVREYLGEQILFVFTSDHGAQWPFGKWNLYDAGIRVPMIVAWPGVVKPGSRTSTMVQWIDILPTLIDAAKGEVPKEIDGRSFLPVLKGETNHHRDVIFTTHSGDGRMNVYPVRAIRTENFKLIWNLHPEYAHTTHIDKNLTDGGGRYWLSWLTQAQSDSAARKIVNRYHQRSLFEFYDLSGDPYEQENLIDRPEHAEKIADMKSQLEKWMELQHDNRTVFAAPRLLSDPDSFRPKENADQEDASSKPKGKKKSK